MLRTPGRLLGATLCLIVAATSAVLLSAPPKNPVARGSDTARLETYTKPDGSSYFALSLMPQTTLPQAESSDVVVMIETSASQVGPYREKQFEVLRGVLATLGEKDRVKLIAVDDNAVPLTDTFVSPRGAEMKAALEKLQRRVPLGATDLEAALQSAAQSFTDPASGQRAAVYVGSGRSNANLSGDAIGTIDRLVKNRISISSYAVGASQNMLMLAALANQTGGVLISDSEKLSGPEAGTQFSRVVHDPVIWPVDRKLPGTFTAVYPSHTPPLRLDRDTILLGKGSADDEFVVDIKGESAGKPLELHWNVKPAKSNDDNGYLVQLADFAKIDGGYRLPTLGSEGLWEARRVVNADAQTLAQLGRQAASSGNVAQAKQFINEAVARDPGNSNALILKQTLDGGQVRPVSAQMPASGETSAQPPVPPEPKEGDLLNSVEQSERVIQQKVMTEATVQMNHAHDLLATDPDGVLKDMKLLMDSVLQVSELDSEQRADLRNRITSLLEEATQRRAAKEVNDVERARNLAAAQEKERLLRDLDRKESQLQGLVDRFNALMEQGYQNFDQITNVAFRAARDDAATEYRRTDTNPYGFQTPASVTAIPFAELAGYHAEGMAVREAAERAFIDTMHLVDVSSVPFPDAPPIVYPDVAFWRKITKDRLKYASVDLASTSPSEQKILETLDKKTDLDFSDAPTPLNSVIEYIKDKHHIAIILDQEAMRAAGQDPTTLVVQTTLKDISLRSALKLILQQFNLTYIIKNEVLQITTKDKAGTELITKVYPVGDLVLPIVPAASQQGGGFGLNGGIGGGGGGGLNGGGGGIGGGGGGFGGGGGGFGGGGGGFGGGGFNLPPEHPVRMVPQVSGEGAFDVGDDLTLTPNKKAEKPNDAVDSKAASKGVNKTNIIKSTVPAAPAIPTTAARTELTATSAAFDAQSHGQNVATKVETIAVKNDVDPDKFWDDYFKGLKEPDEKQAVEIALKRNAALRGTAKELMGDHKFNQVSALIRSALRNGYAQPWMYEALALAMQADHQPQEDVERALMSAVEFANSPSDVINVAIYMSRAGLDARALKLLRQASALEPYRHEPYMHGLKIAQRLNDAVGIRWACLGVLSQAWPSDKKEIVDSAQYAAIALEQQLIKDGKTQQAGDFRKALDAAQARDCKVMVTWNGNADIDLTVEEPTGAICSFRNPRTTGGGVLEGDAYQKLKTVIENASSEKSETYVLPQGFTGQYKALVRRVWGQVATGKVTVDVYTHFGTPQAVHIRKQIPVSEKDALITFDLADGRRTEPLEQAQIATAANNQMTTNSAVLAQQLAAIDPFSSGSNPAVNGGNGVNPMLTPFNFPFGRTGAVGYQPQITVLSQGPMMNGVTAVISADRRYVRFGIPQGGLSVSQIGAVSTFNFATGAGTTTGGGGGGTAATGGGGTTAAGAAGGIGT